jgi:tetratricopeptide (TPR) repeat protein
LYRLVAAALTPLLVLGALEGALRLFGYGYSTAFFSQLRGGGKDFLVNNENFSLRFFPPQLTRWPGRIMMEAHKPADTCRIFILGESAAMGDPEIAFGAGRYLEVLLNEASPGKHFEIINVAITAINSNVVLPIARDCARQNGDLWIIYMGNNEMVGPFGAATIFGGQAPPLGLIRLTLAVQKTRVGQLIVNWTRKLSARTAPASWNGMEMFLGNQIPACDPRKERVYRNFEENLRDIVRAGLDSGARILLDTVAVNLRDCPPFGSLTNAALPAPTRAQFEKWYAQGCQDQEGGRFAAAAQSFEQAASLDLDASAQFRWGQCLLHLTNFPAAHEHFQLACDLDTLPFRTDSRLNGLIEKAGREYAGGRLQLFDAATALAAGSPSGNCGRETFYEHVHFNFDGNYRRARAWAAQIQLLLPPAFARGAGGNWASQETCEQRLGLTDWNRFSAFAGVVRRMRQPPLSTQFNNQKRIQALRDQMRQARLRMTAAAAPQARQIYIDAIKRNPGDHFLHENFAAFLTDTDDLDEATAQWRQVHDLIPRDFTVISRIGVLLARQGKWVEAESDFRQAVTLYPAFGPGWLGLGETHDALGNTKQALEDYGRARRLDPHDAQAPYYIGSALSKLSRGVEAIQSFRQAVALDPDYLDAHFALGAELGSRDDIVGARKEFEEVIRLNPDYPEAHLNLAVALMRQNHFPEAQRELEETLRLEPGNATARQYLRQIQTQSPPKQ